MSINLKKNRGDIRRIWALQEGRRTWTRWRKNLSLSWGWKTRCIIRIWKPYWGIPTHIYYRCLLLMPMDDAQH